MYQKAYHHDGDICVGDDRILIFNDLIEMSRNDPKINMKVVYSVRDFFDEQGYLTVPQFNMLVDIYNRSLESQ